MRIAPGAPVWIREVLMSVDGVDSVPARSLTPLAASHGAWQGMRRLRTRRWPTCFITIARSSARLSPAAGWLRRASRHRHRRAAARDARTRCRPHLGAPLGVLAPGRPLLVAECFLPASGNRSPANPCRRSCRTSARRAEARSTRRPCGGRRGRPRVHRQAQQPRQQGQPHVRHVQRIEIRAAQRLAQQQHRDRHAQHGADLARGLIDGAAHRICAGSRLTAAPASEGSTMPTLRPLSTRPGNQAPR